MGQLVRLFDGSDPHFDTMHGGCCAEWSVAHFCAGDIDHDGAHRCRCGVIQSDGTASAQAPGRAGGASEPTPTAPALDIDGSSNG